MNNRHPRTIARVPKDEPGLGDDIPCSKCRSALDTGLECTECGHDMRPEIYPAKACAACTYPSGCRERGYCSAASRSGK